MVENLKRQFIPVDYEFDLLERMQGLKQGSKLLKNILKNFIEFL